MFRTWREVASKDLDLGHTVYGGGLESEKRIRIYDKSAEQGMEGVWTRYEMVFSGERADEVWNNVKVLPDDTAVLRVALQLLRNMLDFPNWREWQRVFGSSAEYEWTEIPRTESDTWRWLMRQVLPAFRHAHDNDGNWDMLERFVDMVKNG